MNDLTATTPPATATAPQRTPLLSADRPRPLDRLEESGAALVAEMAVHAEAQAPFTIGIFGGPGTGKSSLLEALADRISALGAAASNLAGKSPFLSRIVVARVEALAGARDPGTALAAGVDLALRAGNAQGTSHAAFADEAARALSDPHEAAREADERADAARRRYEAESEATEGTRARLARLQDVILYEMPGSSVDSYARANRSKLEQRLTGFGFKEADAVAAYKNIVGDVAESAGRFAGPAVFLRSIWAFKGQTRLLILAVALAVLGLCLGYVETSQAQWTGWLRSQNEQFAPTADWLSRNASVFGVLGGFSLIAAALCIVLNLIRAVRFGGPVLRGVKLLRRDLEQRKSELETQFALRARRVEMLKSEWERSRAQAEEAERRASAASTSSQARPAFQPDGAAGAAEAYLKNVAALAQAGEGPARIVVAIDGLDSLAPDQAVQFLETARKLLSHHVYVTLTAIDPAGLGPALGSDPAARRRRLEKLVQVPFNAESAASPGEPGSLMSSLLSGAPAGGKASVDASRSALDQPVSPQENELLVRVAALAGDSPRQLKRFLNVWRLARVMAGDNRAVAALMLAAELSDQRPDLSAVGDAVNDPDAVEASGPAGLGQAARAARAAAGRPITGAELVAARRIARRFVHSTAS